MLREPVFEPVKESADPEELLARVAAAAKLTEGAQSTGAMVALYPDAATAAELAIPGGEDAEELHVTLAYLGKAASLNLRAALSAVTDWARACPPDLSGEISGVGQFAEGPVTYLSVDLPDLPPLRERLVDGLVDAGLSPSRDHGFTPHMTLDYARRRPKIEKPIPIRFDRVTVSWGGAQFSFPLGIASEVPLLEALALTEGKWDPSLHPRWPKDSGPKAGQFIKVGDTFVSGDGKEWQVAHLAGGKVVANRVGGSFKEAETGVFSPKAEVGGHVIPDAKKEGKPIAIKSSQTKGLESGVATVDPYVDPKTHDSSIPVPEASGIKEEEWKRFGDVDQEHYVELMQRFGKYTPGKAKSLIDESYKDYEAQIQQIVKNAYSSQYGSSSGFSLSLGSIFKAFGGNKAELAKLDAQRKRALELQGRHKDVVAWDLYNRTRSPDVAVFHKNTNGPSYWNAMLDGKKPIMSGLSQSFNFGANWGFGNNTLATPLAIRHVLMSSYSAQPIPGSTHFAGELEISVAEQIKVDKRSLYFSLHDITENQKKWLMGVTKAPSGGDTIERFRAALKDGEMLPTPPAPADVQMQGASQKLWIDPPPEAASFSERFHGDLPAISNAPYDPTTLKKKGPWAFKDSAGNPKPTVAKESELKPGDYMMGLKGTLYLIVEDPGDETGFGLRYVKIEGGKFTGESYNFGGGGANHYFKLNQHYELPDPHKQQSESELFDPNAWVNGDTGKFTGQLAAGEKFKVNGNPYEVKTQLNGSKTQILDLMSGKVGTINTDYKTQLLVPKAGYVPEEDNSLNPKLQPAKGMTLAYGGTKHTVTHILKDGTVKAKPKGGGKTIAISADDEALEGLYDPSAHKIGPKVAAGDLEVGDLFHGGAGQTQRPYVITGAEGNKVLWRSVDTGEEGVFTKKKTVRRLEDAEAPSSSIDDFNPDDYVAAGEMTLDEILPGEHFSANDHPFEVLPGPADVATNHGFSEVKNLKTGKVEEAPDDMKVTMLLPKDMASAPYESLKPGDKTNVGSLKVHDHFKHDGQTYRVMGTGGPEDNITIAQVLPSGVLGGLEAGSESAAPSTQVIFLGKNPKIEPEAPAPSGSGMADHVAEGGFAYYGSKYGSGGKYTHDKIGDMPVGTIFRGKEGKLWKVKVNDSDVIVTDGKVFFKADPTMRGRAVQADFNDETGPLPGPGADPGEVGLAKGAVTNDEPLGMDEIPVGAIVVFGSKPFKVHAFSKTQAQLEDADGDMMYANLKSIPDKIKLPPAGDAATISQLDQQATGEPESIDGLKDGDEFKGADGKTYTVIAKAIDGVVVQSGDGELQKTPVTATTATWPKLAKPKIKTMGGDFVITDLKPGEQFTTNLGVKEVVAHMVTGETIVKTNDGNLIPMSSNAVLNETQKVEPGAVATLASQWSPTVEKALAQAALSMDEVHQTGMLGYGSKWGSQGKYQHYRLNELEPGAVVRDKEATIVSVVGPGPDGQTLVISPKTGKLALVDETTRVKRIDE